MLTVYAVTIIVDAVPAVLTRKVEYIVARDTLSYSIDVANLQLDCYQSRERSQEDYDGTASDVNGKRPRDEWKG